MTPTRWKARVPDRDTAFFEECPGSVGSRWQAMSTTRSNQRPMVLTQRDGEVVGTLARCLSVMTVEQVRRGWWPDARSAAACTRRLRALANQRLLLRRCLVAVSPVPLDGPLLSWKPGESLPDFGPPLIEARRRASGPPVALPVVMAAAAGAALAGGTAHEPRPSDVTHDLLLAEAVLRIRTDEPETLRFWHRGGGGRRRPGDRVADATLARPGRPLHLEVVGSSYTRTKLVLLHRYFEANHAEYQLW